MRTVVQLTLWLALLTTAVGYAQALRELVGASFEAKVVSIIDGDTIDVVAAAHRRTMRIRLEGIDAPERGEPFNDVATRSARVFLFNKNVRINGRDVDRYGRLVARVSVQGEDASLELVRAGLACHYTKYSGDQVLARAEADARRDGKGFWAPGAQKPGCSTALSLAALPKVSNSPFHGNISSRVYHSPSCKNYNCQNCVRIFHSEADARADGFRPAGDCLRR